MNANDMTPLEEMTMATLLGHRFGDGLVYLQGPDDRRVLKRAMRLGLVDDAGYLTASGHRFWQSREYRAVFSIARARQTRTEARAATLDYPVRRTGSTSRNERAMANT